MPNFGTSFENVDRAVWGAVVSRLSLPSGFIFEVLQRSLDFNKTSLKEFDCKFILQRISAAEIKDRGDGFPILIASGKASAEIPGEGFFEGAAEYKEYSAPRWYKVLYQCSYIATSIKSDRVCSEALLKMFLREYIEAEPGCKIFIRLFDSLKPIIADSNLEVFERAVTWEAEVPLRVEQIGTVPSIMGNTFGIKAIKGG